MARARIERWRLTRRNRCRIGGNRRVLGCSPTDEFLPTLEKSKDPLPQLAGGRVPDSLERRAILRPQGELRSDDRPTPSLIIRRLECGPHGFEQARRWVWPGSGDAGHCDRRRLREPPLGEIDRGEDLFILDGLDVRLQPSIHLVPLCSNDDHVWQDVLVEREMSLRISALCLEDERPRLPRARGDVVDERPPLSEAVVDELSIRRRTSWDHSVGDQDHGTSVRRQPPRERSKACRSRRRITRSASRTIAS